MGDCVHPRSQSYSDDLGRSRCGACGDVWDNTLGQFRPLMLGDSMPPDVKPRVIIVDVRNGQVRADGSNINLPPEGRESALRSIETADVLVEVHLEGIWVKKGVDEGWVTMISTKSTLQMNTEKSDREKEARNKEMDDLVTGEHPVDKKFKRVWDKDEPGYVKSGAPEKGGLKGF